VRFLTSRTQALCFLMCNISQFSPSICRPISFWITFSQHRRSYATPIHSKGGIVFEVAFSGVSDGVGADCIECARATPVTYRHNRRKSPLDTAQRPRYGLSGSMLDAMRRSYHDRRKSPLDAAQRPRYGLSGSTLDAMRRSRHDRRKSPLDAAQRPRYGLSRSTLDAMRRSRHGRRKSRLTRHKGPIMA
jgi:hypothetical protein